MSLTVVRGQHASRHISNLSKSNRNVAAEAFQKAVEDLKKELSVADQTAAWASNHSDVEAILGTVLLAKEKYRDASKDHTGTRAWLEKFSGRVIYYGKVFDALAQHHPEYVALAWGAVKFVLMGIINRATLVQKLAQAFVAIGDVLPRASLSAELYQTDYMKDALSRLYAYIIIFLHLCVKWYNRSSLGRLWSAMKSPFELDYQDLVDQIKVSSAAVEDLANAGARVEIRDIRTMQDISHARFVEFYNKLMDRQANLENSVSQLMQVATTSKTITERISVDVRCISETTYRLEFHHLVDFLAPMIPPEKALLKVQSFSRRDPTRSLPSTGDLKIKRTLHDWASADRPSLLVVRMGLRAQKQARDLAAVVIKGLTSKSQCVFWSLSLPCLSDREGETMASVFKALIHQVLQQSAGLFAQFSEQLNLVKIRSAHTDSEWADIICLLLSKVSQAFLVLETESLHKAYRHDPDWVDRMVQLLQRIVDKTATAGNQLKVLLMVYGKPVTGVQGSSNTYDMTVTSLSPPIPVPPRSRHVSQRSGFATKGWKLQVSK
ncbi:hypothetical protein HBI13_109690 [Parastagonospora nodorum]|nr:hypothetical protein HBI10_141390 [Parastagonospora nodorum]KAH4020992.1 hypothetical protein HBI13_109690 [Parastagonospora nodorum]KAH4899032.1 hypothetical protein HBH74_187190 [Parastagonospora nodorum]KAH4947196.1 hypothetical protein HBH73_135150 [Parastagonospora nodorum]KAH5090283.1 hypothetical protein HBH72_218300 [Parastagonospora nodorum]